jgi:integrase
LTIRASATHVTGKGIVESTTTTRRARQVPVPGPVWDRLKDELPDDPSALVFPRLRGGLLPIEEYRRAFDKGCAQVGIEGLVPHGLRHTTASLAISAGANVKVVQRMLGPATAVMILDFYTSQASLTRWSSPLTTLRYRCGTPRRQSLKEICCETRHSM